MKHDEESMKEISVCGNDAGVISQPRTITPMRPHEVVRTRLCEEDTKYRYFFSDTMCGCSEGRFWVYSLCSDNSSETDFESAIMMATRELVADLLNDEQHPPANL